MGVVAVPGCGSDPTEPATRAPGPAGTGRCRTGTARVVAPDPRGLPAVPAVVADAPGQGTDDGQRAQTRQHGVHPQLRGIGAHPEGVGHGDRPAAVGEPVDAPPGAGADPLAQRARDGHGDQQVDARPCRGRSRAAGRARRRAPATDSPAHVDVGVEHGGQDVEAEEDHGQERDPLVQVGLGEGGPRAGADAAGGEDPEDDGER